MSPHRDAAQGLGATDVDAALTKLYAPDSADATGLIHPSERLEFEAFKWGLATGVVIGLLAALIIFIAVVAVFA